MIINTWIKKGVIFKPDHINNWIVSHAYVPTPFLLNEDTIRIYTAFRDSNDIGRVGYIDVSAKDPFQVLKISKKPCLDIGTPGTFDDNGVSPLSIIKEQEKLYLYYFGWQLNDKVRYLLFTGLAISLDNGETFHRYSQVPILDRTNEEYLIRSGSYVFRCDNIWNMIYVGGNQTVQINGKITPLYSLKYTTSRDGLVWQNKSIEIISPADNIEHGFGRPYVICEEGIYKLWYGIRSINTSYRMGYAESKDLTTWTRKDGEMERFNGNIRDWDNEMQAFAAIIKTKYGTYMFYNGNGYGESGICFALMS